MKKRNLLKNICLSVAILAALCAIMAFSATAEGESKITAKIYKNVNYQGDFGLIFAVDATEELATPVSLHVYDAIPAEGVESKVYTVDAATAACPGGDCDHETCTGLDVPAYVFFTDGVPAKDLAKEVYVKAVDADGKESDVIKYSVGEYLYKRLANEESTAEQIEFYNNVLAMGKSAQIVLKHNTDKLITNYAYVKVEEGTLADGFANGIYPIGTSITPTFTAYGEMAVTTYNGSTVSSTTLINPGDSFTLEAYTVVGRYDSIADFENYTLDKTFMDYTVTTPELVKDTVKKYVNGSMINPVESTVLKHSSSTSNNARLYLYDKTNNPVTAEEATYYLMEGDFKFMRPSSNQQWEFLVCFGSTQVTFRLKTNGLAMNMYTAGDGYAAATKIGTLGSSDSDRFYISLKFIVRYDETKKELVMDVYSGEYTSIRTTYSLAYTGLGKDDISTINSLLIKSPKVEGYDMYVDNVTMGYRK